MEVSFLVEETLGRKVEIVTPKSLSLHIGPHILKEVVRVPRNIPDPRARREQFFSLKNGILVKARAKRHYITGEIWHIAH